MNYESNRLNTFIDWPSSSLVEPARIAKAGFFYIGQGLEVQCFCCGRKLTEWTVADQVMARHRRLNPTCPFVLNPHFSGNVPLVEQCQTGSTINGDNNESNPEQPPTDYGLTEEDEIYKSDSMRLLSFLNWNDEIVSREALVIAGFYRTTQGKLRCAWCGGELMASGTAGSLRNPIEIHRRHTVIFPRVDASIVMLMMTHDVRGVRYFPGCEHAAELEARDAATLIAPVSHRSYLEFLSGADRAQTPRDDTPTHAQTEGAVHNAQVLKGVSGDGAVVGWRALGVVGGAEGAKHPDRATLTARLDTYAAWPHDRLQQSPAALADAGFYYTGREDQVRCFYCDGGLGKWEASDTPWREHARWFPNCGYLLLVKGREYVDRCQAEVKDKNNSPSRTSRTFPGTTAVRARLNYPESRRFFPVTEALVVEQMESPAALAALGAGLDVSRVKRAISRKMRYTGVPFSSSEALIDAALDEQLNEEAWPVPASSNLAAQITRLLPSSPWDERSSSRQSQSDSSNQSLSPTRPATQQNSHNAVESELRTHNNDLETSMKQDTVVEKRQEKVNSPVPEKEISLEEENRQLKEARLCKVCMDSEVSVVFLPCGHLVVCALCGAGLAACPLCRGKVHALVRAYLA